MFYPSLLYGVIRNKISVRRHWFDRIDGTVILGALPFKFILPQLLAENVRAFVNMTEPFETRFWAHTTEELAHYHVTRLNLSTRDFTAAPSQVDLGRGVEFILKHKREGHSVYVHCKAGRTRSATLVACYLMQIHSWTPQQSVQFIKEKRPFIRIRHKQWAALKSYYKNSIEC
jgi:atypical dual specificity phosphatase